MNCQGDDCKWQKKLQLSLGCWSFHGCTRDAAKKVTDDVGVVDDDRENLPRSESAPLLSCGDVDEEVIHYGDHNVQNKLANKMIKEKISVEESPDGV